MYDIDLIKKDTMGRDKQSCLSGRQWARTTGSQTGKYLKKGGDLTRTERADTQNIFKLKEEEKIDKCAIFALPMEQDTRVFAPELSVSLILSQERSI